MSLLVVGVGDCKLTRDASSTLVTHALGSCIAVVIHDSVACVGGLLHFMLPESSLDRVKAAENPWMFGDTGIPKLFQRAFEMGAEKHRIVVRAIGGAQIMDHQGVFNIGKRNYLAMRKILWKAGILLQAEEVGGSVSRSVRLEVGTGRLRLRTPGEAEREITGIGHVRREVTNGGSYLNRG